MIFPLMYWAWVRYIYGWIQQSCWLRPINIFYWFGQKDRDITQDRQALRAIKEHDNIQLFLFGELEKKQFQALSLSLSMHGCMCLCVLHLQQDHELVGIWHQASNWSRVWCIIAWNNKAVEILSTQTNPFFLVLTMFWTVAWNWCQATTRKLIQVRTRDMHRLKVFISGSILFVLYGISFTMKNIKQIL